MKICVHENEVDPPQGPARLEDGQQKCCEYDFSLIDDYTEKDAKSPWRPTQYSSSSHPLAYLVRSWHMHKMFITLFVSFMIGKIGTCTSI